MYEWRQRRRRGKKMLNNNRAHENSCGENNIKIMASAKYAQSEARNEGVASMKTSKKKANRRGEGVAAYAKWRGGVGETNQRNIRQRWRVCGIAISVARRGISAPSLACAMNAKQMARVNARSRALTPASEAK